MKVKKNLKVIISILIFLLVVIFYSYKSYHKSIQINKEVPKIQNVVETFKKETDRDSKLNMLKLISNELEEAKNNKDTNEEIIKIYDTAIAEMKEYYIDEYNTRFENNKLEDITNETDKYKIEKRKKGLENLVEIINKEKMIVSADEVINRKLEEINQVIESYIKRLSILNKENIDKKERSVTTKIEKQSSTHYENEYFSVDVPDNWAGKWSVEEKNNSLNGIFSKKYSFSYKGDDPKIPSGGGSELYLIDMSDHSRPLSHYNRMLPANGVETMGENSKEMHFFNMEAGAGFFTHGAKFKIK